MSDMSSESPAYESVDATEIILGFHPYRISNGDNISVSDSDIDTSQSSDTNNSNGNGNDNDSSEENVDVRVDKRYKYFIDNYTVTEFKGFSEYTQDSDIVLTYFNVLLCDLLKYSEHRNSL